MRQPDLVRLRHMHRAASAAWDFVAGRERGHLDVDEMLQYALVRAVEIIGEAANQISVEGRAELASFPWREVIGMRHRLIHAYFDINLDILWNTANDDIPAILTQIEQFLKTHAAQQ